MATLTSKSLKVGSGINTSGSVVATAGISSYSNSGANAAYAVPWQNSATALEMKYDGTYYMNIETHAQTRDLIFNNLTNDGTGDIRFNTGTGSLTERLAIKADGKISLGTASYIEKDYRNLFSGTCLLYTSPSPRDRQKSRMPSSA